MCFMVPQKYNYVGFCDRCNHTSLRLSRYAYYTVMYTACHNLMSNCPCKMHMTGYGLAFLSAIETCVETVSYGIYVLYIACLLPECICEPAV